MADPYTGPLVVVYARHFSEHESDELGNIRAACHWIDALDDAYALRIETADGRVLYERETAGPSLKWHVRAVDAPPLPTESSVKPWTPDPPRKPPPDPPRFCPACGTPTVMVEADLIEARTGFGRVERFPGPRTGTCENGHHYDAAGCVFSGPAVEIGYAADDGVNLHRRN